MAKLVQIVAQATPTYQAENLNQFGRDINQVVQKLNTTYPQDIKDDVEAVGFFINDWWQKRKKVHLEQHGMKEQNLKKDQAGIKKILTRVKNECIRNTTGKEDNGK